LPRDVVDWPAVWRRKIRYNAATLEAAFDLEPEEARQAAENGVRVEYVRRRVVEGGGGA
jgi:hypothetical protein